MLRPLAVFSIATGVTLTAALQLWVGGARGSEGPTGSASFAGQDLAKLEIAGPTLYHVEASYVDRARVDWEAMYVAALDAVERRVPAAMFGREQDGTVVTVEIGELRTVLEVPPITSMDQLLEELERVAELLAEHLDPDDVPVDEHSNDAPLAQVEYALVNGMLSTLDPHSVLLPPDDAREMDVENQGEFGGLGITLSMEPRTGQLVVQCPIPDTPADEAGIEAEDHIVRIDGESTLNMTLEDAIDRLRGPVGAEVRLDVTRGDAAPIPVVVRRDLIDVHPVKSTLLEGGIGYVKIEGFHEQVERDLTDQLAGLHRKGAQAGGELSGLILDLRGNPGGYLNQAVKVADMFLDAGDIVSQVDGSGRRSEVETARKTAEPFYPVAVLVDSNSASASEIVAGALRYNERAVIVGERTFGKGSVQNLHPFDDHSKLKLTISKYLTPGDRSIQAIGIPADIELDPAVVPDSAEAPARLYGRERVRREADLDQALESVALRLDEPAWRIRYLDRRAAPPCGDEPDVNDRQISITRDILKAATGWRRSDVLSSAAQVVARHEKTGDEAIVAAFRARGVDWTNGSFYLMGGAPPLPGPLANDLKGGAPPLPGPLPVGSTRGAQSLPVDVRLDLGDDGRVVAGVPERVGVWVTNTSDQVLYRVAVVATDNDVLDGREFHLGRLAPGETRRADQLLDLPAGYASERTPVTLEVRDAGEKALGTVSSELVVDGRELPAFAWSWQVTDAKGDGDGVLDEGEKLEVAIELTNVGEGPTEDPFVRLRNRSRKAIDLVTATLSPGERPAHCAAAGADSTPTDGARCPRVVATGQTWKGAFELDVKSVPEAGAPLELEITLGDADAYDYASIVRAGFGDWFGEHERIRMRIGEALPSSADGRRQPPSIEISRAPGLRVDGARATLSGVVTDDRGLDHVMVFVGGDKVFYEGAGRSAPIRSLPFTADVQLEEGSNVITVLATDDQGLVQSRSVVTWSGNPALASAAGK